MATRYYLPSSGAPAISPAYAAAWTDTVAGTRLQMETTKSGTSAASRTGGGGVAGAGSVLLAQYVSRAIGAQTISGTIKGQIRAREVNAGINARAQLVARVIGPDGTVRGTLVAAQAEALSSEFSTGLFNRKFPLAALSPVTVTSVVAQDGDHVVIEVGALVDDNGIDEVTIQVLDNAASDLAEDETSGAANNPWIEFSADIAAQGEAASATPISGMGIGIRIAI